MAWKESKFDPKQRNGRYWGLMQIRVDTARGLGFRGEPADLLDADTNDDLRGRVSRERVQGRWR